MADQLIKLRQFEEGAAFKQWLDANQDPIIYNYVMHFCELEVGNDGQVIFQVEDFVRDIYAPVKVTVNGATYFEYQQALNPYGSFMVSDAGVLTWLDEEYTLKKNDYVVVEYPINEAKKEELEVEIIEDALYLVINNNILVVELDDKLYPLCVEIGADSALSFYVNKDQQKVYFNVNADGTITEVSP